MDQEEQAKLFRELEETLMDESVRSSATKAAELIADQFVEFGRSGWIYHKRSVIQTMAEEELRGRSMVPEVHDFSVRALGDAVLLTYRTVERELKGEEFHTLRSSIWKLIAGRWQIIFHQGTPTSPGRC